MREKKRLLALLLVFTLCFGMVPETVFASSYKGYSAWGNFWNRGNSSKQEAVVEEPAAEPATEVEATEPVAEEVTEPAVDEVTEVAAPAQEFAGTAENVDVAIAAPEGALPEGTEMTVTPASDEAIAAAAAALGVEVDRVIAVDISFTNAGVEIEPNAEINVTMKTEALAEAVEASVVHVDDNANAEVVEATVVGDAVTFAADEFSVYAIVTPDTRTTVNFIYNGSVVNTQIIKGSETLYDPSSEVSLPEGTQFKGWYYNGTLYTIDELNTLGLTGTVDVTAETYRAYSVQYKDGESLLKNDIVELDGSATSAAYTVNQAYEAASQSETFVGWQVQGTETVYTNGQEINVSGNLVLQPKTAKGYWLTFNENGKGATYISPVFVAEGTSAVAPTAPTRAGYTFAGWYTAAEGGSQYTFGTLTENTTVYAHWTMNAYASYTVNYWKQKVTDDKDAETKTYDYAESSTATAASGSTVSGSNAKSYTGFYYDHADTNVTVEPDGSTVVNVYYNRKIVYVYFCGNTTTNPGWSGYASKVTKTISGLYQAPLKEGEWDTSSNGWTTTDGRTQAIFLAHYDPQPAGYETKDGSDGKSMYTYFYKRTGLNALLYYYNEQADGTFKQVQVVLTTGSTTIRPKFDGYELYRKWNGRINSYRTWTPTATTSATFFDNYGSPCSDRDSAPYYNNKTYVISKLIPYNLNYMVNGKLVNTESIKYTASLAGKDAYTPTVPAGKYFAGWYADPACTVKFDFANSTMPVNGVTVYAKFEDIQYRVILEANGGTLPEGQSSDFRVNYGAVIQDSALQEPLFTKEGYTLIGWYTDAAMTQAYNFNTHVVDSVVSEYPASEKAQYGDSDRPWVTGKLNLYAKWRQDPDTTSTITVIYDAVDGSNAPVDDIPYNLGATSTVSAGSTPPSGKVFDHWVLEYANGSASEITLNPGETFTIDADYVQQQEDGTYVVVLQAVYVERHTTFLKYDANNGGTFVAGTTTEITDLALNSDVTLLNGSDVITAKAGYTFLGWDQDPDATTPTFTSEQLVAVDNLPNAENTLYAIWEVAVFYVFHSSTGLTETISFADIDGTFDITAKTADGYYYGGYYNAYNKGTTVYTGGAGSWSKANAYTANGTTMTPVANTTYYLKEVPASYLQPYMHIVYDTRSQGIVNEIKKMYLFTGIDDMNYTNVGLNVTNLTLGTKKTVASFTVTNTVDSTATTKLTTTSIWGVKGYLGVWDQTSSLATNFEFSYQPYFVTPDGITVNGKTTRTVNTQDKHYYNTFEQSESNLGIYKVDQQ